MNSTKQLAQRLQTPDAAPPRADKKPQCCDAHGEQWQDDYAWLRAKNWQQAMRDPSCLPDNIAKYLHAENSYYNIAMAATEGLQQALITEMRGRITEADDSVPEPDGPWHYQHRYLSGHEYPVYFRRQPDGTGEQMLLDINREATGQEYFDPGLVLHSPDHKNLAWSRDTAGAEYYTMLVRDLDTGRDHDYQIADVESAAWADGQTLYYSRVDENHRATRIYRHRLGSDPASDKLVYEEADERFDCGVYRARSGDYVFIHTSMNDQDEVWTLDCRDSQAVPVLIEARTDGLEYSVEHQDERFVILTNAESAQDFKLVETDVARPSRTNWRDLVSHQSGCLLLAVEILKDWVIWLERENALPRICYMGRDGVRQQIAFEEQAYALALDVGYVYQANSLRFDYSSPTTPDQTFDFDLMNGERVLRKTREVASGHNPADYVTRRIAAISHDGAEVPVTLLFRRDLVDQASAPCLLYGYGSYGSSVPASFSANRLSLVDRGFVYALAHVRGGQEKGRGWYEAAKFEAKPNSFHDLIAVARTLRERGHAGAALERPSRIVIHGGSAGGLLVASAVNMQNDMFGGVIADVPFVDVLNTILDDSLPLTPGEWSQWGNPLADRKAFHSIRSYSPYDNIRATDYPPMLVTAGVSDPRVTYWEPAKYVAKLRAMKTDNNPLLLKTNMKSGHFGKTGRFAALEDAARNFAFAIAVVG